MNSFRLEARLGPLLYLAIFLFSLVLRFNDLGTVPLTDEEALLALRAAQGTPHASLFFSEPKDSLAQPSYETLTRILFQIFGADHFLARVVPALAGAALVLTPLLAVRKLGWGQATLMGFLLAFCPIFVTISRTASGASLSALGALAFIMAVLGLESEDQKGRPIIAGAGLGLCIASGPFIFNAILSFGVSVLIWRVLSRKSSERTRLLSIPSEQLTKITWISAVAILVFATGVGLFLNEISGLFNSMAFWLRSWSLGGSYKSMTLLLMIPIYMPTLFLVGLFGAFKGVQWRDKESLLVFIFVIVACVVVMFLPGRAPHDLIWIALPLSFLASNYLAFFMHSIFEGRINLWAIAIASLIILFAFVAYLQFCSLASMDQFIDPVAVWIVLLGFLALIIVILSFFGLGWDWTAARLSAILASLVLAIFLSVSALWRLNFHSSRLTATELWRRKAPSAGLDIMMETIKTASQAATGTDHGLAIELVGAAPYSLAWTLRDFQSADVSTNQSSGAPVILVSQPKDLALQDNYIGQTIAIGEEWGWDSALPPEFLKWWIKRQPSVVLDQWLVLIRQDIAFPGENSYWLPQEE